MRSLHLVAGPALALTFALAGCAADASSPAVDAETSAQDGQAMTADASSGKAAHFVGLYETHAKKHEDGDITSLELRTAAGAGATTPYVRERCYHPACALPLPETDRYDEYTSSAGKMYVRFWSFTAAHDAKGNFVETPTIADVYEIVATSSGVKLRKSYSTRWFTLYATTSKAQCTATGGVPSTGDCICPLNVSGQVPTQVFVPGAGGCMPRPADNEGNCDDSNGLWADDDATLTGAYCVCGLGRYDGDSGACVEI